MTEDETDSVTEEVRQALAYRLRRLPSSSSSGLDDDDDAVDDLGSPVGQIHAGDMRHGEPNQKVDVGSQSPLNPFEDADFDMPSPRSRLAPPVDGGATFVYPCKDVYEGEFSGNQKQGFGCYYYNTGDAYAGYWLKDQRDGWGTFIKRNGLKYEGEWRNDVRFGWGGQTLADGSRFFGRFVKNLREGRGMLFMPNGNLYCGVWKGSETRRRELLFTRFRGSFKHHEPYLTTDALDDSSDGEEVTDSTVRSPKKTDSPKKSANFGRHMQLVQAASNAASCGLWNGEQVLHLVYCLGLSKKAIEAIAAHGIDGASIVPLVTGNADRNLRDLNVTDPCERRGIRLALQQLLKLRIRLSMHRSNLLPRMQDPKQPEYKFLQTHTLTTEVISLGRRIGEGGFCRVYHGTYTPGATNTGKHDATLSTPIAIKVFKVPSRSRDPKSKKESKKGSTARDFFHESQILSKLRHPNIVLFLGVLMSPLYCLITEFLPCGSLFDLVHTHGYPLSLTQILRIVADVTNALTYLHSHGVVHCDVKSPNILIDANGRVKICDFGLAVDPSTLLKEVDLSYAAGLEDKHDVPLALGCVGTHPWMAPEVLRGEFTTQASDVYSFGVLLWELLTREIPFDKGPLAHVMAVSGYGAQGPGPSPLARAARGSSRKPANSGPTHKAREQDTGSSTCSSEEWRSTAGRHHPRMSTLRRSQYGTPSGENTTGNPFFDGSRSRKRWWKRPYMWTANEHRHPLFRHPLFRSPRPELADQPPALLDILESCLDFCPWRRPTSAQLSAAFSRLCDTAFVEVEENLRMFFGQE